MLEFVRIRNLAVVEKAELEFSAGFTAVTGETGAGKSVILGALGLLAGRRADREAIRAGCEEMSVEGGIRTGGAFGDEVAQWLDRMGLPPCEDGLLLICRMVHATKSGRVLVNGAVTTRSNLQELGAMWLDIHGPGEAQTLFHERRQLELLDAYARNGELLARYGDAFRGWRERLAEVDRLRNSRRMGPDEMAFLKTQADSIACAKLSEESVAALERDFSRLEGARDLITGASSLVARIQGGRGVAAQLGEALTEARRLAGRDAQLAELANRLDSAVIELSDIAEDYAHAARECSFDERTAKALRERMELWLALKRKYGPDVASVLERERQIRERIAEQGNIEGRIDSVLKEAEAFRAQVDSLGAQLRSRREAAAHEFGLKAGGLLGKLGLKAAKLRMEVYPESEPREYGDCCCRIVFAPNPGLPPRPLAKIASSGEIARVMLALKTVLAEADGTPVLVFDEVDANVGGEVAVEVGHELAGLGARHQVFAVTHLPQVAAQAVEHFLVSKEQDAENTVVAITPLHGDRDRRIEELARMLGDRHSPQALEHARSLLVPDSEPPTVAVAPV